jgi:hypothetical protein
MYLTETNYIFILPLTIEQTEKPLVEPVITPAIRIKAGYIARKYFKIVAFIFLQVNNSAWEKCKKEQYLKNNGPGSWSYSYSYLTL